MMMQGSCCQGFLVDVGIDIVVDVIDYDLDVKDVVHNDDVVEDDNDDDKMKIALTMTMCCML